ncbi:hypothetical protein PR048_000680 [Dryococelus australis]|uniref:Fibronectin type-III domain-containing protein n=1 Tax=Dryococelus australis TaxID=614101 RepID=A0ABQ9IFB0_9NEOP|nr:hypothetical protein PR048_000680 [Dryococelus australis]
MFFTVPGPVKDLTVYKCSRKVVALRWSPPEHVYGELESFRVSYNFVTDSSQQAKSKVIPPQPCIAWPEYFCYTITGLRPGTNYALTVRMISLATQRARCQLNTFQINTCKKKNLCP